MVTGKPTQDFIPIKEIRDGVVVLQDGSFRSLITASSLNLALKSHDEQDATVTQFKNFLNSLEFSIQIVVQSRRLDIRPYLITLEERLKVQQGDLLRTQTAEYIEFIKWFTSTTSIMTKDFYIVIPYDHAPLSGQNAGGTLSKILPFLGSSKKDTTVTEDAATRFEERRTQLEQRIAVIQGGLSSVGIRSVQLGTQEIIEVYYGMFNPGEEQRSIPNLSKGTK
jgi:hypothetical protein